MSQSQVQADEGTAIPVSVAEHSRYPQKTIRLLKVPLFFGSKKKTHICMECVAKVEKRKIRRRNDWHIGFVCNDRRQSLQDERCEKLILGKANRQINRRRHKK